MRLTWLLLGAAGLTALLAWIVIGLTGRASYEGRTATSWGFELDDIEPEVWEPAFERLRNGGMDALPVVIELAGSASERRGLRGGQILMEIASDHGVAVVPQVLEAIEADDPWRRSWMADALARVQPLPVEALEPLLAAAEDDEAIVRVAAVRALSSAGAWADRIVPVLIGGLADPDPFVREFSAKGLRAYGDAAKPARAALLAAVDDRSPSVSRQAVETLAEIGAGRDAVPTLRDMLEHPEAEVTWWAAVGLGRLGPEAHEAAGALAAALRSEDVDLRALAAEALGRIGPGAGVTVPHLVRVLTDSDAVVRRNAAVALGRLDVSTPEVIDALERVASTEHNDAVREAARAALKALR